MENCDDLNRSSNGEPSEEAQIRRRKGNPCPIDTRRRSWKSVQVLFYSRCAKVHEAIASNGARCVVKVADLSFLDYDSEIEKHRSELFNEISILECIEHENIVEYWGCHKAQNVICIFYEFAGLPIRVFIEEGSLEDSKIPYYTRKILKALEYLHENNIVHCNLKCDNVLVDEAGSVKLTGFKFAAKVEGATTYRKDIGVEETAYWIAPELAKPEGGPYGTSSDIWSLGCTVLEMMIRNYPFPDLAWLHAFFAISDGEKPPIPDSVSGDARDFIERCLQHNPADRPTVSQLLEHKFVCCSSNF